MLAIEPFRAGRVYHWLIQDIFDHESIDMDSYGYESSMQPREMWDFMRREKKHHDRYPRIVNSIHTLGFTRPLTAKVESRTAIFGDGHHRVFAAEELGLEHVPVSFKLAYSSELIDGDSGWFGLSNG